MKYCFLGIWLCLSNQIYTQTNIRLPEPVGPYNISSIKNIELTDTTRVERAITLNTEFRRLNFDLFYPTDNFPLVKVTYWDNLSLYEKVLDSLRYNMLSQGIETNTTTLGKVSTQNQKYPLVIFSPGWQAKRFEFTILAEQLASMGNIVAILDHPYIGYANINGTLTTPNDEGFKSYEDFRDYLGADQLLILEYLISQNNSGHSVLSGRINANKIISIGQSTGFLSTKGVAIKDSRIKKCVSLDASLGNEKELKNLKQDVLLLALERAGSNDDFDFKKNVVELTYQNVGHFSVADWTYLKPSPSETVSTEGYKLLLNYAQNINLFIQENSLDSLVKKVAPHPNLKVRTYTTK